MISSTWSRSTIQAINVECECDCGKRSCVSRLHIQSHLSKTRTCLVWKNATSEACTKSCSQSRWRTWARARFWRHLNRCMEGVEGYPATEIRGINEDLTSSWEQHATTDVSEVEIDHRIPGVPDDAAQQDENYVKEFNGKLRKLRLGSNAKSSREDLSREDGDLISNKLRNWATWNCSNWENLLRPFSASLVSNMCGIIFCECGYCLRLDKENHWQGHRRIQYFGCTPFCSPHEKFKREEAWRATLASIGNPMTLQEMQRSTIIPGSWTDGGTTKHTEFPKLQEDGTKPIATTTSTQLTSRTKRLTTKDLDMNAQSYWRVLTHILKQAPRRSEKISMKQHRCWKVV